MATKSSIPGIAQEAVTVRTKGILPVYPEPVRGYDFNQGIDYNALLESFHNTGFQATNFDLAVTEINKMLAKRSEDIEDLGPDADIKLPDDGNIPSKSGEYKAWLAEAVGAADDGKGRKVTNCTIFLGYTSNMVSCGVREVIRFLAQHNLIDCIVTTAGGIEEDFIKCIGDTYLGDFALKGKELRKQGINRIGNMLLPNDHYCRFEDWIEPILDTMLEEQENEGIKWTPSKFIHRLGKEIDNPDSIYYWCYKNNIPVFSPAITDGSIGDMLYFHSYQNPGLVLDIVEDIRHMNDQAVKARHSGMIILGGGLIKHHICNANLMRNGADFSVFVNTGQEYDGSDAGARPDEAVSWGKIKMDAKPVKVYAEASIIFPLLVAQTFAKQLFGAGSIQDKTKLTKQSHEIEEEEDDEEEVDDLDQIAFEKLRETDIGRSEILTSCDNIGPYIY